MTSIHGSKHCLQVHKWPLVSTPMAIGSLESHLSSREPMDSIPVDPGMGCHPFPLGSQTGALGPGQCDFRRCDPVADSSELTTGGGGTCPDCLVKTPACGPIMTSKKTYGPEMERSPTVWKLAGRKLLASSLLQGHKFLPTRRSRFHSDDCSSWKHASQRISGKVDPWQSKHGNNDTDR